MRRSIITIVFSILITSAFAQWGASVKRKGEWFAAWGWNRSVYSNSTIHFTGEDYDFSLSSVKAKDKPVPFNLDPYFKPSTITIPQTNLRVGYFFADNWALNIGVDHMKYVMTNDQYAKFQGTISDPYYASMVQNGWINLSSGDFLKFEHTDGLNYINLEIEGHQGIYHKGWFQLNAFIGAGFGGLMPKTNVTLMGFPRNDAFHLAGYGVNTKMGLEILIGKWIFLRVDTKCGYINMPDIVTRNASKSDRASQHFFYAYEDELFGVRHVFGSRKNKEKTIKPE
jgi:hypothetical protein